MQLLGVLVWLLSLAPAPGPVVVLSFDGLGAAEFTAERMPRLWRLAEAGLRGEGRAPFPSTTFNGHVTIATGCWPEHHGVVGNRFHDPGRGYVANASGTEWVEREPLWVAATKGGLRAAVYHWPGATTAWGGVSPWRQVRFRPDRPDAEGLTFAAEALDGGARLVMVYLSGIDHDGHRHGPGSPEVVAKLRRIDEQVAPWLERRIAAQPGLRVFLLGDHGMARTERMIDVGAALAAARIPARVAAQGGVAYLHFERREDQARAEAIIGKNPALRMWRRGELPERFHLRGHPRVGDLVVEAPLDAWFPDQTGVRAWLDDMVRHGTHGYDPERPEMAPWLVVLGAGRGKLAATPLWNIAPTVAHWLGIRFAQPPDGAVIPELR